MLRVIDRTSIQEEAIVHSSQKGALMITSPASQTAVHAFYDLYLVLPILGPYSSRNTVFCTFGLTKSCPPPPPLSGALGSAAPAGALGLKPVARGLNPTWFWARSPCHPFSSISTSASISSCFCCKAAPVFLFLNQYQYTNTANTPRNTTRAAISHHNQAGSSSVSDGGATKASA